MNPRSRLLAALKGQKPDRVPLMLDGFEYPSRARIEALGDPAVGEFAHRVFDQTTFFVTCPSFTNRYFLTPPQRMSETEREEREGRVETTCEIPTPRGPLTAVTARNRTTDTTWTVKYPVESLPDVDRIRSVPWELPRGLAPPDLAHLPSDFETRGLIRTVISSPFVCVAGMMPYQYFLELCATEFGLIRELTEECHRRTARVLDVLLAERSVEYVWMGGCEWLTPPMGSPKLYEELVQPFEADLIARVHDAGALCHLHCHGKVRSTMESVIERGVDFFEPVEPPPDGDITFAEAKALAAGRITLGGNVEARVMANEGVGAVEAATRAAFEGGKERMVLKTSAGPIAKIRPSLLANYHRLVDVWEDCSAL